MITARVRTGGILYRFYKAGRRSGEAAGGSENSPDEYKLNMPKAVDYANNNFETGSYLLVKPFDCQRVYNRLVYYYDLPFRFNPF